MKNNNRWLVMILMLVGALLMVACGQAVAGEGKEEPAVVEAVADSEYSRVTLTAKAAQRLGVETEAVYTAEVNGTTQTVVPYAAIIYGLNGETWVYVQIADLTYQRAPITIDHIEGDMVAISEGPAVGTEVATVAVAELYGTDTGVGK